MLNFMGLGFNFGGKDAGLSRAIDGALSSVSKLTSGIAGVSSAMGQLAEKGRDPTTAFEAGLIANNVETTKLAANLGKTGKAIGAFSKQAQSMALEMNRSVDATGSAIGEFERLGDAATKGGIDSAKTMAKLQDVSGVSARVFADSGQQLKKMFGMTKEAGARVMDVMTKAGQAVGDVPGALSDLPARMDILQKKASLLARGVKGIGIEELSKQMDIASVAMQKATGVSAQTARSFGTTLAGALVDSQDAFNNLSAGVGDDVPEVLKGLALTTGDVRKSFELMGQGPEAFMDAMRQMTKNMGGDTNKIGKLLTWISGQTKVAFGDEQSKMLVNYLSTATDATDKQAKAVSNATGALQKYAKEGFKTGYTAAQLMEQAEDLFVTRLRAIGQTEKAFAAEAGKGFRALGDEIVHFAQDKGPIGTLTTSLVDLDKKGLVGLLPDRLQGTAVALGGFTKRLGKTLEGIINPLNAVESGMMLFGTAMADAFLKQDKKTKALEFMERLGLAFETVGDQAVAWFKGLPKKLLGWLNKAGDALNSMLSGAQGKGKWGKIFGSWWESISTTFLDMVPVWDKLKEVGGKLIDVLKTALKPVWAYIQTEIWPKIKAFGIDLWEGITNAMNPDKAGQSKDSTGYVIGEWIGGALQTAIKWLKDNLGPMLDKLFDALIDKVQEKMANAALSIVSGALKFATSPVSTVAGLVASGFSGSATPESSVPAAPKPGVSRSLTSTSKEIVDTLQSTAESHEELLRKSFEASQETNRLLAEQNKLIQSGGSAPNVSRPAPASSSSSKLPNPQLRQDASFGAK